MSTHYSGFSRCLIRLAIVFWVLATVFLSDLSAKTLHVSPNGDGSDGLEWSTAFPSVSEAIAQSASGDHIWIEQGRYNESIALATGIHLYGGFNGDEGPNDFHLRDWEARPTILDATTLNSRVVMGADETVLDGLFIENGRERRGAGVFCEEATMTIRSCVIRGNGADELSYLGWNAYGAGLYVAQSDVVLEECQILDNGALHLLSSDDQNIVYTEAAGGGIYCYGSKMTIHKTLISGNSSDATLYTTRGTVYSLGGGICAEGESFVALGESTIHGNQASAVGYGRYGRVGAVAGGGGIYCARETELICKGCKIEHNSVHADGSRNSDADGGGIHLYASSAEMSNTLIIRNAGRGGALYLQNASANFNHCTITTNGDGIVADGGSGAFTNSIMWDPVITGWFTFQYTAVGEPWSGTGVINIDPLFQNPDDDDYRLAAGSPCIDSGTTSDSLNDIENETRPIDIPGIGRDGTGDEFDMGAYEKTTEVNATWTPTQTPTLTPTRTPTITPTFTPTPNFQTYFVDGGVSQSGDGLEWGSAFKSIGEALIESVSGDQIWVKEGVYLEGITLRDGVDLYGGFVGSELKGEVPERNWERHKTILTADHLDLHKRPNLVAGAADCTFDGFILDKGRNGLTCINGNMRIVDCLVRECWGHGLEFSKSQVFLKGVKFYQNRYWYGFPYPAKLYRTYYANGGAVYGTEESELYAVDCILRGNSSWAFGFYFFVNDEMVGRGGAIMLEEDSDLTLRNCEITNNVARADGDWWGIGEGGGLWLKGGNHRIENCTIAGNSAMSPDFSYNDQIYIDDATATIINSIIWNDGAGTDIDEGIDIRYCCVDGGYEGEGNIDIDPMFYDLIWEATRLIYDNEFDPGDYRLLPGSPCIDSASTMGATHDLLGTPRPIDVPGVGRDGTGDEYDMGAYESPVEGFPTLTPTPTATPTVTPTMPFDECVDGRIDGCDLV
ncbi:MAG: right-handed parallel beta-helix repeat-containing protein, partial [Candidatus Omnitrophica bacterium]|nr:right-handed parallel beta-helix repeat-containing protein [Candidatus Omnitrophota bacterium]